MENRSGDERVVMVITATMLKRTGLGVLVAVLAVLAYWTTVCPCERTPGLYLFGDAGEESVADWTFANDVELCALQIQVGLRPHAINLNCMATDDGNLYLSCSVCDTKYWASKVETDEPARLRLDGVVYPVKLNRVTDDATMDLSWQARISKLRSIGGYVTNPPPADAPRPYRWWTFRVESRS